MRHSARQASVNSSPFQQAGIMEPDAVQPGHAPRAAWYLMGHSKARWLRPGLVVLTAHKQPLVKDGMLRPMLDPTMRGEIGFPRKGPVGSKAWQGGGAGCRAWSRRHVGRRRRPGEDLLGDSGRFSVLET